jgi:hypothetical protein
MPQKIRRVVTGHNAAGKAVILFDDHAPNVNPLKGWPGAGVTEVWVTDEMPVSISARRTARCGRCGMIPRFRHHLPRRGDPAGERRNEDRC